MNISELSVRLMVLLIVFATDSVVANTMLAIANKDKITKFFKNLFTKGKKKKLTEPEPVTEAPISSTPPHKRKRMRPPKPKRPKIELHPLCFIEKAFGWISAKAKLVAQKSGKLFVGLLKVIGKVLLWIIGTAIPWLILTLLKSIWCVVSFKWFVPFCEMLAAPLDRIDEDTAFAVGGAVLGIVTYGALSILSSALDG